MNKFLALGLVALFAAGCTDGGSKCDSGDTDCGSGDTDTGGGGGAVLLQEVGYRDAGSDTITWFASADGGIGTVEVYIAETGDTTSENFWTEDHDAFSYTADNSYGGEDFELTLDIVCSYKDQVRNSSTLFDLRDSWDCQTQYDTNDGTMLNHSTIMFMMYDTTGAYADCAVYGNDPSYYSSDCSNNWN